jgi:hypothetical protein
MWCGMFKTKQPSHVLCYVHKLQLLPSFTVCHPAIGSLTKNCNVIHEINVIFNPCACLALTSFIANFCTKLVFTLLRVSTTYCSHHQAATITQSISYVNKWYTYRSLTTIVAQPKNYHLEWLLRMSLNIWQLLRTIPAHLLVATHPG